MRAMMQSSSLVDAQATACIGQSLLQHFLEAGALVDILKHCTCPSDDYHYCCYVIVYLDLTTMELLTMELRSTRAVLLHQCLVHVSCQGCE